MRWPRILRRRFGRRQWLAQEEIAELQTQLQALDFDPGLLTEMPEAPRNWFPAMDTHVVPENEDFVLGHREEARLGRITVSSDNAVGAQYHALSRVLDRFGSALPRDLSGLWFEITHATYGWLRLECAAYYNAGVERGLDLAAGKEALGDNHFAVDEIDSDALFALAAALSDLARRLPVRSNDQTGEAEQ